LWPNHNDLLPFDPVLIAAIRQHAARTGREPLRLPIRKKPSGRLLQHFSIGNNRRRGTPLDRSV
jgi:hypothetical protein